MATSLPKIIGSIALLTGVFISSAVAGDLKPYVPAKISGQTLLTSVGSDSMGPLLELWVEAYKEKQPNVAVNIANSGSASAPAALIEGSADLGPMARPMKGPELQEFREQYGFEPTQVRTAIAGVAIYVSSNNPRESISMNELKQIFGGYPPSVTGQMVSAKAEPPVKQWAELGVSGAFGTTAVMPIGQVQSSYSYLYFKQQVLAQTEFASGVAPTADNRAMFEVISKNPGAIAYGEVDVPPAGVKILPVVKDERAGSGSAVLPSMENMANGDYPLARFLNVYIVRYPTRPLDAEAKDFLTFVLSKDGQDIVRKQGLTPLPASIIHSEIEKIQ